MNPRRNEQTGMTAINTVRVVPSARGSVVLSLTGADICLRMSMLGPRFGGSHPRISANALAVQVGESSLHSFGWTTYVTRALGAPSNVCKTLIFPLFSDQFRAGLRRISPCNRPESPVAPEFSMLITVFSERLLCTRESV